MNSSNLFCDFVAHEMVAKNCLYFEYVFQHEEHYFSIFFCKCSIFLLHCKTSTKIQLEKSKCLPICTIYHVKSLIFILYLHIYLLHHHHITKFATFSKLLPLELIEVFPIHLTVDRVNPGNEICVAIVH